MALSSPCCSALVFSTNGRVLLTITMIGSPPCTPPAAPLQPASAAWAVDQHPTPVAAGPTAPVALLPPAGPEVSRARMHLASASAVAMHTDLSRPDGTRYVTLLYAWMADEKAAQNPLVPPAPPGPQTSRPPSPADPTPQHSVTPMAPATRPADGGVWAGLRQCESDDNYSDNTGNGYYGAYQFSLPTWHGLGFSGLPSAAPPAVQDRAAQQLEARSGWGQWPSCSRRLRLT